MHKYFDTKIPIKDTSYIFNSVTFAMYDIEHSYV